MSKNQYRSQAGETLVELLIAVFIISLAAVMFASASLTAVRLQTRTKQSVQEYYEGRNQVEAKEMERDAVLRIEEKGTRRSLTVPADSFSAGTYPIQLYFGTGAFSEIYRYQRGELHDTD